MHCLIFTEFLYNVKTQHNYETGYLVENYVGTFK